MAGEGGYTSILQMNTIFVTGAAGFIGSNLVDRLLADGKRLSAGIIFPPASRNFSSRRWPIRNSN